MSTFIPRRSSRVALRSYDNMLDFVNRIPDAVICGPIDLEMRTQFLGIMGNFLKSADEPDRVDRVNCIIRVFTHMVLHPEISLALLRNYIHFATVVQHKCGEFLSQLDDVPAQFGKEAVQRLEWMLRVVDSMCERVKKLRAI